MKKHFILLRGLVREKEHWGEFITQLKSHFPESRITCLDIPGAGVHHQKKAPLSISGIVLEMRSEFLLQVEKNEEVIGIAVSLGGMIISHWASEFENDFSQIFLINTSFAKFSPLYHRLKPLAFYQLGKNLKSNLYQKELNILKVISNREENYLSLAKEWEAIQEKRPVSLSNTLRQLTAASRFTPPPKAPKAKTFIITSIADRMVSYRASEEIAKRWKLPLIKHQSAGHDLSTDEPQWLCQTIKESLDETSAS